MENVRIKRTKSKYSPELHKDGTVTYFHTQYEIWFLRDDYVPETELNAMSPEDKVKVIKHLRANKSKRKKILT